MRIAPTGPQRETAILIPLTFCGLALVLAAWSLRPLNGDGAIWFLTMAKTGRPYWFPFLCRPFDSVVQLPAVALMHLFKSYDWGNAVVTTWCFGYSLHPLLSLWLSLRVCRKYGREDLFLFP